MQRKSLQGCRLGFRDGLYDVDRCLLGAIPVKWWRWNSTHGIVSESCIVDRLFIWNVEEKIEATKLHATYDLEAFEVNLTSH